VAYLTGLFLVGRESVSRLIFIPVDSKTGTLLEISIACLSVREVGAQLEADTVTTDDAHTVLLLATGESDAI
jgi:hypothetical protein